MSLALIQFPATLVLDRTADGRFRAEVPARSGQFIEADTIEQLLDSLKVEIPIDSRRGVEPMPAETADEDDPGGPGFDADLDRVILENRELLDRLASSQR